MYKRQDYNKDSEQDKDKTIDFLLREMCDCSREDLLDEFEAASNTDIPLPIPEPAADEFEKIWSRIQEMCIRDRWSIWENVLIVEVNDMDNISVWMNVNEVLLKGGFLIFLAAAGYQDLKDRRIHICLFQMCIRDRGMSERTHDRRHMA